MASILHIAELEEPFVTTASDNSSYHECNVKIKIWQIVTASLSTSQPISVRHTSNNTQAKKYGENSKFIAHWN